MEQKKSQAQMLIKIILNACCGFLGVFFQQSNHTKKKIEKKNKKMKNNSKTIAVLSTALISSLMCNL